MSISRTPNLKNILRSLACTGIFLVQVHADVVRQPLQTEVVFDVGQIVNTAYPLVPDGQVLQSTNLTITQAVDLNDRLSVEVGIGGLFFYTTPNVKALDYQRGIKFGTTVAEAMGIVKLGALGNPIGSLKFGIIPFKYNPDAKNLGEFLLRDQAYPTIMVSGGLSAINSAGMQVQGLDLELQTGPFKHSLLAYIERGIEPTGDISSAYIVSFNPHPSIEFGAGVALAHLISIKPSKTTPTGPQLGGASVSGQPLNRYKGDTVVTDVTDSNYSNYTFKATKLMARVSFNPQVFLKDELLGPEDLKIYGEVAVLGVKDYPFYYSNVFNRIPIMGGINLPTFKLFDRLSFEIEYIKSIFPNSVYWSYENNAVPIPGIVPIGMQTYHDLLYGGADPFTGNPVPGYDKNSVSSQRLKWSVYLKKTLVPGLKLYAQVASDNMRGYNANVGPGALVMLPEPLVKTPGQWYYLVRFDVGI
jgi:hypothetical protein